MHARIVPEYNVSLVNDKFLPQAVSKIYPPTGKAVSPDQITLLHPSLQPLSTEESSSPLRSAADFCADYTEIDRSPYFDEVFSPRELDYVQNTAGQQTVYTFAGETTQQTIDVNRRNTADLVIVKTATDAELTKRKEFNVCDFCRRE